MDALTHIKQVAKREKKHTDGATDDWRKRVTDYHSGVIDDDRVTCVECGRWFGRCREKLGCAEHLKRRCIRYIGKA